MERRIVDTLQVGHTGVVQLIYVCQLCKRRQHIHGGGQYSELEKRLENDPDELSFGTRVSHCEKDTVSSYELVYVKNHTKLI